MSLAALKKQSNISSLIDEYNKQTTPQDTKSFDDERIWKPELDKSGNGYAVIRFLPAPEGEDVPWQRMFTHSFQGPGGWYIENSLTTINKKDPVGEVNRTLWNTGSETDKETARRQKRKLSYFTNIYVVADPKHPEHEGKVFLYKFGKKIFDKIMEAMQPQFDDEEAINPFDLWKGANFKLKIRKVDGFWNYDKSEFETVSPLLDTDEALEKVYGSEYPLKPFHDESNFKSYTELKEKMERVLGETVDNRTAEQVASDMDVTTDPPFDGGKPITTGGASDTMEYFEKLATA
ncbi:MAG: single-stranded DNA-binding protein [Candidatus Pacebacteria bacterium]|nr:single-stranded DNA-binding protein [Candidatus Paceibacterota bacterium]